MSTCLSCNKTYKNAAGLAVHMRSCKASGAVKSSIKTPKARTIPAALMELIGHEADQVQLDPQYIEQTTIEPAAVPKAARKRGKAVDALGDIKTPQSEIKCDDSQSNIILALVNKCHNIMRDQQAITGMIAYQDIIKLLFLRFMEPELSGKLAHLLNPAQYENIVDIFDEPFKPSDVQLLKFSVLRNPKIGGFDEAFKRSIYIAWDMLSKNSYTQHIFEAGDRFKCNMTTLYICLEEIGLALEKVNFDKLTTDIKGDIYEHFVNGYSNHKGKDFGQFFTPRKMIKLIFKLNAHLFPDFKPTSIYDPCAGTGGFLTEMHKICKCPLENIHGGEIEPTTFASLVMNLLLSTGSICDVEQRNSLEFTKKEQYDWIGTNPPFGMRTKHKSLIMFSPPAADFKKAELYPCDVNDGSALFLQSCAARLKPGGICNIVLPYGEIFFGLREANRQLRKYMMTNYDIRAVLIAPEKIFDHADVAVAILYFTTGKTSAIRFFETDLTCKEFKQIKQLTIAEINANNYSWLLKSYDEKLKIQLIDSTWTVKKLGEVCELRGGTAITRAELTPGEYPVIASGTKPSGMHNKYNREPNTILCASSGMAGIISMYKQKIWASDCFSIHPNKTLLNQYLFYYLKCRQDDIYKFQHGATHKHVNMSDMETLEIPICSPEKQQEIVTRYEAYDAEIKSITDGLQLAEKLKIIYDRENIAELFNTPTKKLENVCEIKAGKFNSSDCQTEGKYPFYTGKAKNPEGFSDNYCFDYPEYLILIKGGGAGEKMYGDHIGLGKVFLVYGKSASMSSQLAIVPNKELNVKFMYHYVAFIKNDIMDLAHYTTRLGSINHEAIKNINIPTPTLERQQEIIAAFEQRAVVFAAWDASNVAAQQLIDMLTEKKKLLFVGKA